MSTRINEMPFCFFSSFEVRTRQKI